MVSPQTLIAKIAAAMDIDNDGSAGRAGVAERYPAATRAGRADSRCSHRVGNAAPDGHAQRPRRRRRLRGAAAAGEHQLPVGGCAGAGADPAHHRTAGPAAGGKLEIRRRRSHRGQVDVRKTLQASMSTVGYPST